MGVRSAVASGLTRAARAVSAQPGPWTSTMTPVRKSFGPAVPADMRQAARDVSQMDFRNAFAPGEPIGPYDGFRTRPREWDFTTGRNISGRPRSYEPMSFETMTAIIGAYDVAQICINHRIDSLRSLDWSLVAADGYAEDVKDAIATGMAALSKPDGEHFFDGWLTKWLWDVLAWDAGTLYRRRNNFGEPIGLLPVDGRTIAPLIDNWGNSPQPPAEAYVQYVNGIPWDWLTRDDLIYEPFWPRNHSPYGEPPIESVVLASNTDLRFQAYFLQRFTDGNLPAAFASAPESWTPEQIENFQEQWDAFMAGQQFRKSQVRWIPPGSKFEWSNEKDFDDQFSLFLMRKVCAAYSIVPSDLGFTEDVNRSSGESQADVQHRVGDLPLIRYVQRILTSFLADDLHLPLKFLFDIGEEQDDRLNQAGADQIYIQNGVVSASEIRRERFGYEEPEGHPVPRYIFTTRSGPVPLSALFAVAGPVDQENAAPDPREPLPEQAFTEVQGVLSNPPVLDLPLAEHEYGPSALPPAPPMQAPGTVVPSSQAPPALVTKEGETAGITAGTGLTSYDLTGDEDEDDREQVAKAELAAFRRFRAARRRAGQWRDFEFAAVERITAHNLNDSGRLAVRKDAGQIAVAGLAVKAADTGRVLMIQRAMSDDDPAAGLWEFAGGHCEDGETPLQAAWREWAEECGVPAPPGVQTGTWLAGNGIYQGFVWTADSEQMVPVRGESIVANPDDPDGDAIESIAWWDPADIPGNPAVRPELLADIGAVMAALGDTPGGIVKAAGKTKAGEVLAQLSQDYPEAALGWVHHAEWEGPAMVPFDDIDTSDKGKWRASHEPDRVDEFADRIKKRARKGKSQLKKPAVLVREPGAARAIIVDGHHRFLGAQKAGEPGVLAWTGHVDRKGGPWTELHDLQFTGSGSSAEGSGDDEPKDQVGKGRDSPKGWAGWRKDRETAACRAVPVVRAVTAALTDARLRALAEAWTESHPPLPEGTQSRKRARSAAAAVWLSGQGVHLTAVLAAVAAGIVTDGYLIGAVAGTALVTGTEDWGGWQPGGTEAAQRQVAALGLAAGLAHALAASAAAASIAGGITAALARALTDGQDAGTGAAALAAALRSVTEDDALATALALDQVTTASGDAARDCYRAAGCAMVNLLTEPDCCAACAAIAAGNPHPVGSVSPPIHINCRCATGPALPY